MKIITDGREKTFLKQCKACGTDFEYTLQDVEEAKKYCEDMNLLMREGTLCVKCPVCDNLSKVNLRQKMETTVIVNSVGGVHK